jgi:nitrous oxidase accessory protein NosD
MKNVILVLSLAFSLTSIALAETYRYTPGQAYLLLDVFNNLESGDRVILERGTYRLEHGLKIANLTDITIEGQGRVTLLVDSLDDAVIQLNGCKDITIKGLRAAHTEPAEEYQCEGPVVEVRKSERVFIARNRLNGCGAAGVHAYHSQDVVIYKNRLFNNTYAAVWVTDSQVAVHGNWIYDNAATLCTFGKCDITFTENKIENNSGNDYIRTDFFERAVRENT